jgi:hypothetical protein
MNEPYAPVTPIRGNRIFQELVSELVAIAKDKGVSWDVRYDSWKRCVENDVRLEPRDRKTLKELGAELIGP